jgi:hypothetical protein
MRIHNREFYQRSFSMVEQHLALSSAVLSE